MSIDQGMILSAIFVSVGSLIVASVGVWLNKRHKNSGSHNHSAVQRLTLHLKEGSHAHDYGTWDVVCDGHHPYVCYWCNVPCFMDCQA